MLMAMKDKKPLIIVTLFLCAYVIALVTIMFGDQKINVVSTITQQFSKKEEESYSNPNLLYQGAKITNPVYEREFPIIKEDPEKKAAIKEAFLHAWNNYKKYCWGEDTYVPSSGTCNNQLRGGLTIIDSLSTLYVMGLKDEFAKAREFVEKDFRPHGSWNIFEFIIRFVGGFLSAYDLSGDKLFLDKAKMCADAILPLIDKTNGFIGGNLFLSTDSDGVITARGSSGRGSLAVVGTYQLEFLVLSKFTNDPKYAEIAMKVYKYIWNSNPDYGLITKHGFSSGENIGTDIGAEADSYYEYISKIYVLLRGKVPKFMKRHVLMARDIKKKLLFKSKPSDLTGIGVSTGNSVVPMMEHLATFAGAMFAVGAVKENPKASEDLKISTELAKTFYTEYTRMKSGVGPERMMFNTDPSKTEDFKTDEPVWMMRPESVESVYTAWKFTGLPKFRDYAWQMFLGINKSSRVEKGFANIADVNSDKVRTYGEMESFFLAETLKYLYLTFEDSRYLSSAEWVYNTEAHPLRIFNEKDAEKWATVINNIVGLN